MNTKNTQTWIRAIVLANGILYVFVGLALLFAPAWFLENVGPFPPLNRHYMGDLGSFTLPMGIGLVLASANPARHLGLILVVLGGSLFHIINHVYDAVIGHEPIAHWLTDPGALIPFAAALLWAAWMLHKNERVK
jgi:hypothetical protein